MKQIFIILIISITSFFSFAQTASDYFARGSKVYIQSNNEDGILDHTRDKILLWGYWKAVDAIEEADFILNLDAHFSLFYTINAQAITHDDRIIKRFKSKNSFSALDPNPKRGAVKGLFDKEIIPFVHALY